VLVLTPWATLTSGHLGLLMLALIVAAIMLGFPRRSQLMGMGVMLRSSRTWIEPAAPRWPSSRRST